MTVTQTFGEWLGRELDSHQLTRSEAARHLGVSRSALHDWLRDRHRPRGTQIVRIASLLGIKRVEVDGWLNG